MDAEVQRCYEAFTAMETQRTELLGRLAKWTPQRIAYRPTPDSWCAIEVLDHIVRAESGTIADLKSGLQHPHPIGPGERPGIALLDRALRSDKKFPIPAGSEKIFPDASTTFPDVLQRWDKARKELDEMLRRLTPAVACCAVFHHPFAGWMTFAEVLHHFHAHLYHHTHQLARLEEGSA